MLNGLYARIGADSVGAVIVSLGLMMFAGFAATRVTKRLRLPNVTAYILTGILIGPYALDLIPARVIEGSAFLPDLALAFIAFSVGEYFKLDTLRKNGLPVLIITLFEALMASVLVFVLTYFVLGLGMAFSIVLAALASATAPASTLMTIRQTKAHGDLVDTLLQVVAVDDVVGLVAFSVAISVALASLSEGSGGAAAILLPLAANLGVMLLGCLFGWLLKWSMGRKHSTDNRLIIALSVLLLFCGVCSCLDVSPLLGCMSMGTVYINASGDDKLFKQLNYFSPPILLLFFVRSGLSFRLDTLLSPGSSAGGIPLLAVGVSYFFVRIAGKYAGAYLGCLIVRKPRRTRRYLGLALIPQAGVSIGLAAMCARTLGGGIGQDLQTIILASSVLYEIVGPPCAKLALYLSHSYATKLEELTAVPTEAPEGGQRPLVEVLTERIRQIQQELQGEPGISEEEAAFTQAAEEQFPHRSGHFLNE